MWWHTVTWWAWACLSQTDDHPATGSTGPRTTPLAVGDNTCTWGVSYTSKHSHCEDIGTVLAGITLGRLRLSLKVRLEPETGWCIYLRQLRLGWGPGEWWSSKLTNMWVCVYWPGEGTWAQTGLCRKRNAAGCCRGSGHPQLDCWLSAHCSETAAAWNVKGTILYLITIFEQRQLKITWYVIPVIKIDGW